MADAGAADMGIRKTHTKNGIIGMRATVAGSTYRNGTPAKRVHGNTARTIIKRHIHVGITTRMYKQDGCPAESENTRNICRSQAQNMANDWQARRVVIIIITFYVKTRMNTPRNPPLIIVQKVGKMT